MKNNVEDLLIMYYNENIYIIMRGKGIWQNKNIDIVTRKNVIKE